jgi:hypothetical protein
MSRTSLPALRQLLLVFAVAGLSLAPVAADLPLASDNAYLWLRSRTASTGLVDSYQDKKDVCYTYDQAVAAMAFTAKGDLGSARSVLDALQTLQNADGSWNSAYACSSKSPLTGQRYVGAIAWVALAVAHYERRSGDAVTYHNMAERAIDWFLLFQQGDGGINGGLDADGIPLPWASTEHNQDAYAVLAYFSHPLEAAAVKSFLDNVVWDGTDSRWLQGRNDTMDPLDVNPLGVCALGAAGAHDYQLALDYALVHHRNAQIWRSGRTRTRVDGFDFDSDRDDIWLEGTAQMAAAFAAAGRTADAAYFLAQIAGAQQKNGGIPYSVKGTFNGDFTMSRAEAVASTGWFILAVEGVNPLRP